MQQMTSLTLTDNNLSGTLPASWASGGAFPLLNLLNINNNTISGALLASWGNASAFQNLSVSPACEGIVQNCVKVPAVPTCVQHFGGQDSA